jgi:hypothetical protein
LRLTPALQRGARLEAVADEERAREDLAHVPRPFVLVRVEQRLVGEARDHPRELPGEVQRVADARAHPLSRGGRHHVRGVAREEHPPQAPALGHEGLMRVGHHAEHLQAVGVDEAPQPRPQGLVVGRRLALVELKLPAAVEPEAVGVEREPLVVQHVAKVPREVRGVGGVAEPRVDDEPVAPRGQRAHRHVHRAADGAAPAVAPHHPRRAPPPRALGGARGHGDPVVVRGHRVDGDPEVQRDVREAREAGAQHALEGGLVEEAGPVAPVHVVALAHRLGEQHRAVGVDHLDLAEGGGVREQRGEEPRGLKVPQGLFVDVGRAAHREHLGVTLQHRGAHPQGAQEVGEHHPRRTAPDDQHVTRSFFHFSRSVDGERDGNTPTSDPRGQRRPAVVHLWPSMGDSRARSSR